MVLRQDVVNALATKHGLILNPIETGSDGTQRVCLERDEIDDRYCQALLAVRSGKVFCATGLYRESAIINDGEVQVGSVDEAFAHAAARFNIHAASLAEQYLENEYASYVNLDNRERPRA